MKHPHEGEIRLGQGIEKARQFLIDNPEVAVEIDKALRAKTIAKATEEARESAPASTPAAQVLEKQAPEKTPLAAARK
jgi:recombination protein RecA